jgi:PAS domain S-box-containing protein
VAAGHGLVDRQDLALIAVHRTRMSMVVTDPRQPDNPIVLANQAFLDATGYEPAEVVGRNCRFLQGPGTAPEAIARIRAALRTETAIELELLNYRKDGSTFLNQLHVSPVHNHQGRLLYFFASQRDVTEGRQAQALKDAEHRLLREVDHRAMNALALVQAITRLTKANSVSAYATAVQGRVSALARAHALLAQGGWRPAPLEQVLLAEVGAFSSERVVLDGPLVMMPANLVQPIMVLTHEMLSNAAAHGALSVPGGILSVSWRESAPPGRVHLRWREHGRSPEGLHPEGFGLRIVRSILQQQLGGALMQTWEPNGLVSEMSFPTGPSAAG